MTNRRKHASEARRELPAERSAHLRGLLETATHGARVGALLDLGVTVEELALTCSVAVSTVRTWQDGSAAPRHRTKLLIDDLRLVAVILLEAGLEGVEVGQWLRSRNRTGLGNERPLEIIAVDPQRVLAAAEAEIVRRALARDGGSHLELVQSELPSASVQSPASSTSPEASRNKGGSRRTNRRPPARQS